MNQDSWSWSVESQWAEIVSKSPTWIYLDLYQSKVRQSSVKPHRMQKRAETTKYYWNLSTTPLCTFKHNNLHYPYLDPVEKASAFIKGITAQLQNWTDETKMVLSGKKMHCTTFWNLMPAVKWSGTFGVVLQEFRLKFHGEVSYWPQLIHTWHIKGLHLSWRLFPKYCEALSSYQKHWLKL